MAALTSHKATTKDESVGLVAHQHIILQMAKELSTTQALKYDQELLPKMSRSGEIKFPSYGRCLSSSCNMPIPPVPLLKDAGVKKQEISPPDAPICYK